MVAVVLGISKGYLYDLTTVFWKVDHNYAPWFRPWLDGNNKMLLRPFLIIIINNFPRSLVVKSDNRRHCNTYPHSISDEAVLVVVGLSLTQPPLRCTCCHINSANALTRKRYHLMYQLRRSAFISRNIRARPMELGSITHLTVPS